MSPDILVLLMIFQVKHLIADFFLQFPYMYKNKGKTTGWVKPLAMHAFVHMSFTFFIVSMYCIYANVPPEIGAGIVWGLMLFDFCTHFIIDRWKATRKGGPDTERFWYYLGIDQGLHQVVMILMVYVLGVL